MDSERSRSILLLILVMVIWGSTFVVTKSGLAELPPLLFAFLRFMVATAALLPLAHLRGGLARLPQPVPWGTITALALTGVLLYYLGFNVSLAYTTASQAALVQSTVPVVTAVMAALWLGERISAVRGAGILLTVAGVVLIFSHSAPATNAPEPLLGNAIMFGCVLTWGVYTTLYKRIAHADPVVLTACVTTLGTAMLAAPALIESWGRPPPMPSAAGWFAVVYLGLLASAACYLFYNRALRTLDASQVGSFVNLVPLIGVLTGVVFLGESLPLVALAGGMLVLTGVWISTHRGRMESARDRA